LHRRAAPHAAHRDSRRPGRASPTRTPAVQAGAHRLPNARDRELPFSQRDQGTRKVHPHHHAGFTGETGRCRTLPRVGSGTADQTADRSPFRRGGATGAAKLVRTGERRSNPYPPRRSGRRAAPPHSFGGRSSAQPDRGGPASCGITATPSPARPPGGKR